MRILLVEDEPTLQQQLAAQLGRAGYAVDTASDGNEALFLGREYDYDIALVDIGLPGIDGIELIKRLRAEQRNFPILVLTARGRWQDKVAGLEAGGDDYVVKPLQWEEIHARINALLRRSAGHASPELRFGPLCLQTQSRQVFLNDTPVELTSYEYNTLEYLALRRGQVISKAALTEHLYDQDYDRDSNVIEVFIARLRKKIDPDGQLQLITTVRGSSYRFNEPL